MISVNEIANWMLDELIRQHALYQNAIVYEIKDRFGEDFTYINANGNLAISLDLLSEFKKISNDKVIWDRRERCWRFREDHESSSTRTSL